MTLTISGDLMTSDQTGHWAAREGERWQVTWLRMAQICDRNEAITAMLMAEIAAEMAADAGHHLDHRQWPLFCDLAAELLFAGLDALGWLDRPLEPAPLGWRTVASGKAQNPATGQWRYIAEGTQWARDRQRASQ